MNQSIHSSIEIINSKVKVDTHYLDVAEIDISEDVSKYIHDYANLVAEVYPDVPLTVECTPVRDNTHVWIQVWMDKVGSIGSTLIDLEHPEVWRPMDQEKYFLQIDNRAIFRRQNRYCKQEIILIEPSKIQEEVNNMATNARYKLIEVITSNSVSKDWEHAVQEWSMTGCRIDRSCSSSCVCGQ